MSDSAPNGQPAHPQIPPAEAGEEEPVPVVDTDNDDGYEADDEGEAGWPQDPFNDDDNFSIVTDEGEEEENEEEAEAEEAEADNPDQPNN